MILWIKIFLEWLIFLIKFVFIWRQNIDVVERMIGMIMANLGHQPPPPLILLEWHYSFQLQSIQVLMAVDVIKIAVDAILW